MKRITKILLIVLTVALAVCGLVIAGTASAAETTVRSGETSGFDYYTPTDVTAGTVSTTDDLQVAFEAAAADTVIYLNGDHTLDFTNNKYYHVGYRCKPKEGQSQGDISPSQGALTLDLDGNTLVFAQTNNYSYLQTASNNTFTVRNGTVKAGCVAKGEEGEKATSYPIFRLAWGAADLVLENVNTYTGGLISCRTTGSERTMHATVKGGTHYVILPSNSMAAAGYIADEPYWRSAFIDCDNNGIFVVEQATIYIAETNTLISSTSYGRTTDEDKMSVFVFDNCNILGATENTNLIAYANEHTRVRFDACNLYGKIDPALISLDDEAGCHAVDVSLIKIGTGTRFTDGVKAFATLPDGASAAASSATVTTPPLPIADASNGFSGEYTMTATTATLTLTNELSFVDGFEIFDASGNSKGKVAYGTALSTLIASTPAGGTLKFLTDCTIDPQIDEAAPKIVIATINKEMTIDLDGHVWTLLQHKGAKMNGSRYENVYEQRINIGTSSPVVIKNGTLRVNGVEESHTAYSMFNIEGSVADITFENIDTHMATLVYEWRGNGSKVTINGGTHHVALNSTGGPGGYISSGDNIAFTANNATFILDRTYASRTFLLAGSHASAAADNLVRNQTFTYNNCDILAVMGEGSTAAYPLIERASADTTIYFNNSRIWGTFDAIVVHNDTKDSPIDVKSIKYGQGTVFVNSQLRTDGVVVPARGIWTDIVDGGGSATTLTKTYTVNRMVNKNAILVGWETEPISYTFTYDKTVDTKKVFEILDTDGTSSLGYLEDEYIDGELVDQMTFYNAIEAITARGSGYTLKFLGDYTIGADPSLTAEGSFNPNNNNACYYAKFDRGVTVDLNHYELRIIKGVFDETSIKNNSAGQEQFNVSTTEPVIFKNGTVKVDDDRHESFAYALFSPSVNGASIALTNVDTYTGGIVYSYSNSVNMTITGGTHVMYRDLAGAPGSALMHVRNSFNLTATDARFFMTSGNSLLAISSQSASISKNTSSTVVFNGCDIVTANPSKSIILHYNGGARTYFNGCTINGSINPGYGANDAANRPIEDYSVIMGRYNGVATRWATGSGITITDYLLGTEDGYAIADSESNKSITDYVMDYEYAPHDNGWAPSKMTYALTFTKSLAEGYTVDWYLYDSTEPYATTSVLKGGTAVPPRADLTDVKNGYYELCYAGTWSTTPISTSAFVENAFANSAHSLVVNENLSLYPTCTLRPLLTSARYNLQLNAHFTFNFYVPASNDQNVTIKTIGGSARGTMTLDGASYYYQSLSWPTATELNSAKSTTVVFTVGDILDADTGAPIVLTQYVKNMSPLKYLTTVLNDSTKADAHALMASVLGYSKAVWEASKTGYESNADYTALLAAYNTYKDELPPVDEAKYDAALTETTADYTTLGDAVTSATFVIYSDKPRIVFKFKENTVTAVTMKITEGWIRGAYKAEGAGYNWGQSTVSPNAPWDNIYYATTSDGKAIYVRNAGGGKYYSVNAETLAASNSYYVLPTETNETTIKNSAGTLAAEPTYLYATRPDNVPIYNCDKILQLTVTTDSATYQGTYDVDTYYTFVKGQYEAGEMDEATFTKIKNFVFALRTYSAAAAAYRFSPAKDSGGNYVYWN